MSSLTYLMRHAINKFGNLNTNLFEIERKRRRQKTKSWEQILGLNLKGDPVGVSCYRNNVNKQTCENRLNDT
jgi:hypothetical protein